MPQERHNPFPYPIASEVDAAPGTREIKAARIIMARPFKSGIPSRGYLLGDCDHAPILQSVASLTAACYALLDAIEASECAGVGTEAEALRTLMEDHGCPETRDVPEGKETLESS